MEYGIQLLAGTSLIDSTVKCSWVMNSAEDNMAGGGISLKFSNGDPTNILCLFYVFETKGRHLCPYNQEMSTDKDSCRVLVDILYSITFTAKKCTENINDFCRPLADFL